MSLRPLNRASRNQVGFATIAKALFIVVGATSAVLIATTNGRPVVEVPVVASQVSPIHSPRSDSDPDGELRVWLREPQPPTF